MLAVLTLKKNYTKFGHKPRRYALVLHSSHRWYRILKWIAGQGYFCCLKCTAFFYAGSECRASWRYRLASMRYGKEKNCVIYFIFLTSQISNCTSMLPGTLAQHEKLLYVWLRFDLNKIKWLIITKKIVFGIFENILTFIHGRFAPIIIFWNSFVEHLSQQINLVPHSAPILWWIGPQISSIKTAEKH